MPSRTAAAGFRGRPAKPPGSRWGVADAVYPVGFFDPHHPLVDGTMKKLRSNFSEGGLPKDLGWLKGGLWVAIALDPMAYVEILRGENQEAAKALYAVLNHATPLFSWCEERLPEKGASTTTGDLQHAWTPICVARFLREMLVMEQENGLHLCSAVPDFWLEEGEKIQALGMPTYFGQVDLRLWVQEGRLYYEVHTQKEGFPLYLHVKGEQIPLCIQDHRCSGDVLL